MKEAISVHFQCPYYKWSDRDKVQLHCEGGCITIKDDDSLREYIRNFCGSDFGWKRCTVARAVTRFYEVGEDMDEQTRSTWRRKLIEQQREIHALRVNEEIASKRVDKIISEICKTYGIRKPDGSYYLKLKDFDGKAASFQMTVELEESTGAMVISCRQK